MNTRNLSDLVSAHLDLDVTGHTARSGGAVAGGARRQGKERTLMSEQPRAVIHLAERWRLTEDGDAQWLLQKRIGERWRDKAWCGTREGLLIVALPHNRVAAAAAVLARLRGLPNSYTPEALEQLLVKFEVTLVGAATERHAA